MSRFIRRKAEVANPEATMVHDHGIAAPRKRFEPEESNVFLVGLRGSGKTTVGRLLAERLGVPFLDTDEAVFRLAGQDIAHIVARQGWDAFRAMESQVLRDVCGRKGQVVATGGGIVLDPANRELLLKSGVVFYLLVDVQTLARRLAESPMAAQRPPLSGLAPEQEIGRCMEERGPLYMSLADHVLLAQAEPGAMVADALEKLGFPG